MNPLLSNVIAKIERASVRLVEFERDAEFARNAYSVRVGPDFSAGVFRFIAKDEGLGDPPVPLMLLAGEIAHQLRSSLDHISFLFSTGTSENDRYFPICDCPNKFQKNGLSKIKGMCPSQQAAVESIQPYHDADPSRNILWMLHRLDIIDKHRVIPACMVLPNALEVDVGGDHHSVQLSWDKVHPKDGTELTSFSWDDLGAKVKAKAICEIAFLEVAGSRYEPIVPFFTQAVGAVRDIAERF
jgi:hypothetical protein